MATLGKSDFIKAGRPAKSKDDKHPYFGLTRYDILKAKIKDGKPFLLGKDGKDGKIFGLKVIGKTYPYELDYSEKKDGEKAGRIKVTQIFKDKDFGGGTGSGGGAADTEITESLQCYYTSVLYNGSSTEWKSLEKNGINKKILKKYAKYCDANVSLDNCLKALTSKKSLVSWGDNDPNIFVVTANAIKTHKFAKGFSSPVYFHRGSKFMKEIYERRKRCMNHDKKEAQEKNIDPIAPASFSDDKWNPGDIWMSTLPKTSTHPFPANKWEGKLGTHTCDWSALSNVVYHVARSNETLAVSLKKVTAAKGKVTSYNLPTRQQNKTVKYLGFTFGQTGDFFGSADIYVYFQALPGGKKAIQWRAFDSVKSWQGEIKGSSAAGGKIGGGGTNYYCEKHFDSSICTSTNKHGKWQETTKPDWKHAFTLYEKYNKKQLTSEIKGKIPATVDEKTFNKKTKAYLNNQGKNTPDAFKFGKYMGLLLIDTILSNSPNKDNGGTSWASDTFRYASSNIDISSYFIKVH